MKYIKLFENKNSEIVKISNDTFLKIRNESVDVNVNELKYIFDKEISKNCTHRQNYVANTYINSYVIYLSNLHISHRSFYGKFWKTEDDYWGIEIFNDENQRVRKPLYYRCDYIDSLKDLLNILINYKLNINDILK